MEVSFISVGLAAVVAFVVGFIWYLPAVFGNLWMKYAGVPEDDEIRQPMLRMALAFVASLLMAWVLAHIMLMFMKATGKEALTVLEAVQIGTFAWLGFMVPTILSQVLWEQKDWRLFVLNGAAWLVTLVAAALVIAFVS